MTPLAARASADVAAGCLYSRPRGIGVRRRRRGPEGLRAAGGARRTTFPIGGQLGDGRVLRRPGVSASVRRAPKIGDHAGSGALRAPLMVV
jgi:hypothetical protein